MSRSGMAPVLPYLGYALPPEGLAQPAASFILMFSYFELDALAVTE